jgi:hypothetical protein
VGQLEFLASYVTIKKFKLTHHLTFFHLYIQEIVAIAFGYLERDRDSGGTENAKSRLGFDGCSVGCWANASC